MPSDATSLTDHERHFIQVLGLYFGADAVSSIFLSLFLFRSEGFAPVAEYWIASLLVLTFGMIGAGYMMRTRTNRWMIRLGLLFFCVQYALVLALGTKSAQFPALLGAINGSAMAVFWSGVNVTELAVTHEHTRSLYMGTRTMWTKACPTAAQALGGVALTVTGLIISREHAYFGIFGLLLLTYAWTFHHARDIDTLTGVELRLRDSLNKPPSPGWIPSLAAQFFRGLIDVPLLILPPVLIYLVVDREIVVSTFIAAVTLLGAVTGYFAGRILQKRSNAYLIGAAFTPLGMVIFTVVTGWPSLIGYALIFGVVMAFSSIPVSTAVYDAMESSGLSWQHSFHYFIENEIVLNAGRLVSFSAVLLLIPADNQAVAVRHVLLVLAIAPVGIGLLQRTTNRQLAGRRVLTEPVSGIV